MYGKLAGWFHLLTPPADYRDEATEILRLLELHAAGPVETALELGSGGGNVASHLSGRLRLTLSDLAPQMLALSHAAQPSSCQTGGGTITSLAPSTAASTTVGAVFAISNGTGPSSPMGTPSPPTT